ncbi:MAG TPA: PH domain-containing protein [Actinomycetota bacterium]|nr:PH domain-containing protein [Actinomycetota bacterium]
MAFPTRLLVEGEELILDLRPHWIALVMPAVVAIATVAVMSILYETFDEQILDVIVGVAGTLFLLMYSVRRVVDWATSHFVVTSDRIIHRRGWIAKYSMDVPLEAINDVRFEQGIVDRTIGAGTLIVQSASEAGRQVFDHIRNPEEVQKTIYHQGELNQQRMMGRGAAQPQAPSTTTELERLADLRARGVLTEEEFQEQKRRILG